MSLTQLTNGNKVRKSNVELLRILSMLGVIVLHYNNQQIGGGLAYATSWNKAILVGLESVCISAVNIYILISAYFLCRRDERGWKKPLELIVQVMIFDLGFEIFRILMGQSVFSVRGLFVSVMPDNYFVILYIGCFLISPLINAAFRQMGEEDARKILLTGFVLFSIWPTVVDTLQDIFGIEWTGISTIGISGSQAGYTIVNFLLVYAIGAYIGMFGFEALTGRAYKSSSLLLSGLCVAIVIATWWYGFTELGFAGCSAWDYCNPLVIIEAVIIMMLFVRMPDFYCGWVNRLAKGSFTVYLLNIPLLQFAHIPEMVQKNLFFMMLHILGTIIVIYLVGYVVYEVYHFITKPLFGRL